MSLNTQLKSRRRSDYLYHLEYRTRWSDNDMYHHVNNSIYNFLCASCNPSAHILKSTQFPHSKIPFNPSHCKLTSPSLRTQKLRQHNKHLPHHPLRPPPTHIPPDLPCRLNLLYLFHADIIPCHHRSRTESYEVGKGERDVRGGCF